MGREKTTVKPIFLLNPLSIFVGLQLLVSSPYGSLIGGMLIGGGIIGTGVDFSSGRGLKVRKDPISVVLEESEGGSPN